MATKLDRATLYALSRKLRHTYPHTKAMTVLHMIAVKFLPSTAKRGPRVKLTSARFDESVTLPYVYTQGVEPVDTGRPNWAAPSGSSAQAKAWLEAEGFNIVGCGQTRTGIMIVSTTMEPLKSPSVAILVQRRLLEIGAQLRKIKAGEKV